MSYEIFSIICLSVGWISGLFTGMFCKTPLIAILIWLVVWSTMFIINLSFVS